MNSSTSVFFEPDCDNKELYILFDYLIAFDCFLNVGGVEQLDQSEIIALINESLITESILNEKLSKEHDKLNNKFKQYVNDCSLRNKQLADFQNMIDKLFQKILGKLSVEFDDGSSPSDQYPLDLTKFSIQRCMHSLLHACQCRNANCMFPGCQKMLRVVEHNKFCRWKAIGNCPICKQLFALCWYHANYCLEKKCPVPFCFYVKVRIKQNQLVERLQQAILLRRREVEAGRVGCPAGTGVLVLPAVTQTSTVGPQMGSQ